MIFVPCTTSLVAYSIIFRSLFANNGLVNYVLVNIGILDKPYNFLTQPFAAKMVILLGLCGDGQDIIWYFPLRIAKH